MNNSERFDSVLYGVPPRISEILAGLPKNVKENAQEIRLRANLPVALTVLGDTARTFGMFPPYLPKFRLRPHRRTERRLHKYAARSQSGYLRNARN